MRPAANALGCSAAGVVVLGEGTLIRQLFMNFVWLVGTYLFAAILGVITGDIMEQVQVGFLDPNHATPQATTCRVHSSAAAFACPVKPTEHVVACDRLLVIDSV